MKKLFMVVDRDNEIDEPYGIYSTTRSLDDIEDAIAECQTTDEMYDTLDDLGCIPVSVTTIEW